MKSPRTLLYCRIMIREHANNPKSKIVFHEMIFHIDKIWYFVYGCVSSYLTIRWMLKKLDV